MQPGVIDSGMNADNLPTVSIVVPCFNEQDTISLLLNAIKQQSYPSSLIETIIVDGKSTDRTVKIIGEF